MLDAADSRLRLAREIAHAAQNPDQQIAVVHGGGKQMTRFLAERGIESEFVNGLRVTSADVLDAVVKVLAGSVNHELVSAFVTAGAPAVGLNGLDGLLAEAEQMNPALGFVGRVVRGDARLLTLLMTNGYLPVVACVAGDRQGQTYNVNADQMAVACASALGVDKLLFLTDVDGVRDGAGAICPELTAAACQGLIDSGVASGGMRAKLDAATDALRRGVPEIVIAPGGRAGVVQDLLAGSRVGTRLF